MPTTYELRGDVAVVTIDRPGSFNAIDLETSQSVLTDLDRAGQEARALVLTGAGRAFSSGVDLAGLKEEYDRGAPDLAATIRDVFNPLIEGLHAAEVPTIAAVNGAAAGAGMGIALACDLRVVADSAFFMSAFINVAVIPDSGTPWSLPRLVGLSRAMELAYTGRRVPAEEAVAIGLAHRAATDEAVVDEAVAWAAELAEGPTAAYVATRRLLLYGSSHPVGDVLAEEMRVQGEMGLRPEHLEAVDAFLSKRKPDFKSLG
ncbi:MAG: enoyl-CoA hydratase-related protein [Acidimicrobiia bacterium]